MRPMLPALLCLAPLAMAGCTSVAGDRGHAVLSAAVSTAPSDRDRSSRDMPADEPCSQSTEAIPQIAKPEAENIAQSGGLASRRGRVLRLRLDNGKTAQIVDVAASACYGPGLDVDKCRDYKFVAHLPEARAYLVHLSYWEGGAYLLVDTRTGKRTEIVGAPRFSPDGKRFVAIFNSNYAIDNYEIWSLTPTGPRRELKGQWPWVDYCFLGWEGNERVRLRLDNPAYGPDSDATRAEIVLAPDGWQVNYLRDPPR